MSQRVENKVTYIFDPLPEYRLEWDDGTTASEHFDQECTQSPDSKTTNGTDMWMVFDDGEHLYIPFIDLTKNGVRLDEPE